MVRVPRPSLTIIPLVIGFLALVAIVSTTFRLNERAQANFDDVSSARSLRVAAVELRSALQSAEGSQRGYLYTDNEIYLAPYDVAKAQARKQLQIVKDGLTNYPDLQMAGVRLGEVTEQKIAEMEQSISLKQRHDDDDARSLVQTNRGKALMDEANIFLSGIIRATDQKLLDGVQEEQTNASLVRLVSIIGALVILGVVTGVGFLMWNYTKSLSAAKEEVSQLNIGLEQRVAERTTELAQTNSDLLMARDRAEVLLAEVNHRVANSLTMVSTLVKLQANSLKDQATKDALADTQTRINAVSLVHRKLYTSGNVEVVSLSEYLTSMMENLQASIQQQHKGITLIYDFANVTLPADQTTNLGVILNEWVSNAVKYAYPLGAGEINVSLRVVDGVRAVLTVADEGMGFASDKTVSGTGFGTKIVKAMATSLSGQVEYIDALPGTISRMTFPIVNSETKPR